MATRWNSKHTGQKIDDTIDYVTNPNLLDNWYFGNPVNQRGVSSGNGPTNAYGIDRWKFINAGTLNIDSESITIASDQHYYTLQQYVEPSKFAGAIGQTVTLSALIKGTGRLTIVLGGAGGYGDWVTSSDWTLVQMHGTVGSRDDYYIYVQAQQGAGNLSVKAVKLELGSQQTLAHQDADGNWVLNEIPNYGEQLLRCQRHMLRIGYTDGSTYAPTIAHGIATAATIVRFFIPTPVAMRISPALRYYTSISSLKAIGAGQSLSISSFTAVRAESNGILLIASVTGATTNETYSLYLTDASGLLLDANL